MKSIPIETERLIIKYIEERDVNDMYEYASLDEVCEYLLWSPHINSDVTRGYIEHLQKRYIRGLYADWAITLKDSGKMIGTCGYASIDSWNSVCEIGYVLSPTYQGCGYMTEAVNAVLSLTFDTIGMNKAVLRIINENARSKKLAERVGFRFDRVVWSEMEIKDVMRDIAHYEMTDEEYKRKKEAV